MIFINGSDLIAPGWRFLEPNWTAEPVRWSFHHGVASNRIERLLRRPNIARYRAAITSAREAARETNPILVGHLPRMTAAMNVARRTLCPKVPLIGFAFNFTDLPGRTERTLMRRMFAGLDEAVVFSKMERTLYARALHIPEERIHYLPWCMDPPVVGPDTPVPDWDDYICAIGGEARDYPLLANAMRQLPKLRLAIVARPYSVAGIDFPQNVRVFTNLPGPLTWRLAADSLGLVVPLRRADTACGHITIVGARLLGIPLVATRSTGIEDYVSDDDTLLVNAGAVHDMADALRALAEDRSGARARADRSFRRSKSDNDLSHWMRYLCGAAQRLSAPGEFSC